MTPGRSWIARLLSGDRRSAERHVSPPLVAYYWDGAMPVAHPVRDISAAGLYLLTKERWYPGTLLMMRLQRTDNSGTDGNPDRSIAVESMVIRFDADGVGLGFVFPDSRDSREAQGLAEPADRKALARFCLAASGGLSQG